LIKAALNQCLVELATDHEMSSVISDAITFWRWQYEQKLIATVCIVTNPSVNLKRSTVMAAYSLYDSVGRRDYIILQNRFL
jgi:hypothetical protein